MQLGLVGLGKMGFNMRERIRRAGHEVVGYDRNPEVSDADSLADRLQSHGVPAHPVRDGRDLVEHDPQLAARGFYPLLQHPLAGAVAHEGLVARLSSTPGGLWEPAPLLGQHTDDLLTKLLPRLAVGGQCAIEDRYLHVKGTRHTYKIHLGSGNIMIEPDNRYLCIVPKSDKTDTYLPFEGDRTLAVILSKAMVLAKDAEITDPTILSQL